MTKETNMTPKRLLKIRESLKRKRPSFKRVESWRYKRVKSSWRRARGIDSKTRRKKKSGVKSPTVGYRSPKAIRGLHPSGYREVVIQHVEELEELDPDVHAIKISRRLGARKRLPLLEILEEKGFRVLNVGKPEEEIEELLTDIEGFEEPLAGYYEGDEEYLMSEDEEDGEDEDEASDEDEEDGEDEDEASDEDEDEDESEAEDETDSEANTK